ncbi:hypothetical protein ACFLUR_01880 [Chloroflexota bacterium]
MAYSELLLETYVENVAGYPNLTVQIGKLQSRILENPYHYSHGLKEGKHRNLNGLRSVHMWGGKFVFLIAICEDCVKNGHMTMNQKYCSDRCEQKELARVVFIGFNQHDVAYGKL